MFIKLFPVLAIIAALLGFQFSDALSSFKIIIEPLLMLVMLSMGLTLKLADFVDIKKYRKAMFVGMFLQFTVMPLSALFISVIFEFSQELTLGMVLVGSVAGGLSSNVMTYIAGGHLAMSVSMTALSTLLSVFLTPVILTFLLGSTITIPAMAILMSLLKIILLPVILGIVVNKLLGTRLNAIRQFLPSFSIAAIVMIIAIVVALNSSKISHIGFSVAMGTLLHNCCGLILGYLSAYLLGFNNKVAKTIALEVGMQNSALATALALKFFVPIAALPGAIFSIWLNITGSIFASVCHRIDNKQQTANEQNFETLNEQERLRDSL